MIAAVIMLFALLPTAKLTRSIIAGLLDAFFGSDPAGEGVGSAKSGLVRAGYVAGMGLRGLKNASKRPSGNIAKARISHQQNANAKTLGDGQSNSKSINSENSLSNSGYLPEKQNEQDLNTPNLSQNTSDIKDKLSTQMDQKQGDLTSPQSTIVDKHGQPISSNQNVNHSLNTNNAHVPTDQNTNEPIGANHTEKPSHQSKIGRFKQSVDWTSAKQRISKGANIGGRIGEIAGRIPSTVAGMAISIPLGAGAGYAVTEAGATVSKVAGKAIGGIGGFSAHAGALAKEKISSGHIKSNNHTKNIPKSGEGSTRRNLDVKTQSNFPQMNEKQDKQENIPNMNNISPNIRKERGYFSRYRR